MDELGIKREEIFVITKIYPGSEMAAPETSIQACLDRLDIGYVDMMLLHHPDRNDVTAYQAMEKFVEVGQIRSLGLSNWYVKELDEFLLQVNITPALVQNKIYPYYQENDVIPGSSNPDHIKENTELYGFTLTDAEMEQINALERNEKHDWY